jgi:hypothetical protein
MINSAAPQIAANVSAETEKNKLRRSRRLAPKDKVKAQDPEPFPELPELAASRQEGKRRRRKEKLAARKLQKKQAGMNDPKQMDGVKA